MTETRRTFLRHAATATAGLMGARMVPVKWLTPARTAEEIIAAETMVYDETAMRALAARALNAAKAAGVDFADVRINQVRALEVRVDSFYNGIKKTTWQHITPMIGTSATIGVRAVVDGVWGFAGGPNLTLDGAENVARIAAAFAHDGRRRRPKEWKFAPAPPVPSGRWETPIETDPFSIPLGHYVELYQSGMEEMQKVKGIDGTGGQPGWSRSERFFASTEGSEIYQRIYLANPGVQVWALRPSDRRLTVLGDVNIDSGQYGFETLAKADLKSLWRRASEEAVRKASLPFKAAEVGRYDIVFSAESMSGALLPTGRALELDRALGYKANEGGTTFAMPPKDILGKFEIGTPLITISGERSRPHAPGTIGWDEEGVRPEAFTLVREGTVVDYVTTRSTAPEIASWYSQNKKDVHSHGCAARTGRLQPALQLPNLNLEPGHDSTKVEDLIQGVKRGYYLEFPGSAAPDQQIINILMSGTAYEITNGKLGPAVIDLGIQFALPQFWKNVAALGGAASVEQHQLGVDNPDYDRLGAVGSSVVPALVRQLNVVNLGKEA